MADTRETAARTAKDFSNLIEGVLVKVVHNRATLTVEGEGDERRFVMEGPSGRHTLLVAATDLDRLNAHWTTFTNDSRNKFSL